jgi:acyl-CoA oxidase
MKSPSVTSAKFWPGVLGLVATHSVVQAKAFVKGKSIGVQTFVIEIRDQNLNDLKGVESGDIGPKFGFHRVDNGYVKIQSL